MSIVTAIEKNGFVHVYDNFGAEIWKKEGTLQGYTCKCVTINDGVYLHIYDENEDEVIQKISCKKEQMND